MLLHTAGRRTSESIDECLSADSPKEDPFLMGHRMRDRDTQAYKIQESHADSIWNTGFGSHSTDIDNSGVVLGNTHVQSPANAPQTSKARDSRGSEYSWHAVTIPSNNSETGDGEFDGDTEREEAQSNGGVLSTDTTVAGSLEPNPTGAEERQQLRVTTNPVWSKQKELEIREVRRNMVDQWLDGSLGRGVKSDDGCSVAAESRTHKV